MNEDPRDQCFIRYAYMYVHSPLTAMHVPVTLSHAQMPITNVACT